MTQSSLQWNLFVSEVVSSKRIWTIRDKEGFQHQLIRMESVRRLFGLQQQGLKSILKMFLLIVTLHFMRFLCMISWKSV
jgi:hypothetical protein